MKTYNHRIMNRWVPAVAALALSSVTSAVTAQQLPPPAGTKPPAGMPPPNGPAMLPRPDPKKQPPQGQPPQGQPPQGQPPQGQPPQGQPPQGQPPQGQPPQGQPPQGQPPQGGQRPPMPGQKDGPPLPPSLPASFILPSEFRAVDGSSNNLTSITWGTPDKPFIRLAPNTYADGVSAPSGENRPSPRVISNAVAKQQQLRPNRRGASDFLWQWGQFLDHDLDETPTADPVESLPISVPTGDPSFDPTSSGTVTMGLSRSAYETVLGVREQKSAVTAWIDASHIYGSTATLASALRANDGTGRLLTSSSAHGDLLPTHSGSLIALPPVPGFFVAGDIRVNEQVGLIAIHTLFMREHNYWADLYRTANTGADDEEIYQFARLIVSAEMQAISYREFIPTLLGPNALKPYRGYKAEVNPTISNEFATAAYRLGHSLLSPALLRLDETGTEIGAGNLTLAGSFFQPQQVTDHGVDVILRGLATGRAQELDEWIIDDVRDFLFGAPGAGGLDLASLNIQRGRDHGLPSFAQMRVALKLRPVTRFQDVNPNRQVVAELDAAYDSPADIDLWIGGLAEADRPGSMVGETFQRILVDQFTRVRDGDRFWYEKTMSPEMVRMINAQTLSVIIHRNTEIKAEVGKNAFMAPPPRRAGPPLRNQPPTGVKPPAGNPPAR